MAAKKKPGNNEVLIPDKLYFRIGEVAKLCRLPAYVLRFWETEFPQLKPTKGSTGQRMYRRRDVENVLRIQRLLYDEGFTIAGARQFGNEDQGWVAHFLYSALLGTPITIFGSGLQVRDVLHVNDLTRAFEAVLANRKTTEGQVYNVGGGTLNTVSLVELMAVIEDLTGIKCSFDRERLRPGDQLIYITDFSKLTRDTGWRPEVSVGGVLESLYTWFKRNRDLFSSSRVADMQGSISSAIAELGRTA